MKKLFIFYFIITVLFQGCYSFKGTSIPPSVTSFYVQDVFNATQNSPPTIGLDFRQKLIDKVRSESRLIYLDQDPDIEFKAQIVKYAITAIAPKENNTPSYNQLDITVQVSYIDNTNEKNNWENSFSFFETYGANETLSSVEEQLIEVIFNDIVEKIFNKAFTNW